MMKMGKNCAPRRYFLGANTAEGFTSYYHEFPPAEDGFLWYIKGGPGNGKSTLMKRLALSAEEAGKTVEYAYCSGDPDSLDGIYIREDRVGYVDATSPHVQEPEEPGASGQYLDLSGCYRPGIKEHRTEIKEYFRRYRAEYGRSYDLLKAAALSMPEESSKGELAIVRERARALAAELIKPEGTYRAVRRFLSAYTCKGRVSFWEDAEAERLYVPEGAADMADAFLQELSQCCRELGCRVILCPDPLTPQRLEGLILPGQGLAFAAGSANPRAERVFLGEAAENEDLRRCRELREILLFEAVQHLREAKHLHDELEALCHPYVDFSAVDEILRTQLRRLPRG